MSDPMKQAWNDVAEDFSRLGKAMKERYQGHAPESTPDTDRGRQTQVCAAFERLLAAGREFGERISDVVAGDDVRAQAKQTGQQLNDAMTATADLLGEQLRGVFKGAGRRSDPVDTVAEDAPADAPPVGGADPAAGIIYDAAEPRLDDPADDELG